MPAVEKGLNLTLDHMENPLKNKNFEKNVLNVKRDQKIGPELNFHDPSSSNA